MLRACRQGSDVQSSEASLPYELLALEAALAAHSKGLEAETAELEGQAKPSLEHLLLSVRPCHIKRLFRPLHLAGLVL